MSGQQQDSRPPDVLLRTIAIRRNGKQTLAIGGNCAQVMVSGSGNTIRLTGRVQALAVKGDRNTITWSGAAAPRVSDTGKGNAVKKE